MTGWHVRLAALGLQIRAWCGMKHVDDQLHLTWCCSVVGRPSGCVHVGLPGQCVVEAGLEAI